MSDYDLTQLGFYQFDNLVQNRVPFVLLNEPVNFGELYGAMEKIHLDRWSIPVDFDGPPDAAMKELEERKIPFGMPIILLGREGDRGQSWVAALENHGFKNTCYIPGGWQHLLQESKAD